MRVITAVLASVLSFASFPTEAQNFRCTPATLQAAFREIVSQCGGSFNNAYRPGAIIRGTRNRSQHSYCNGRNGAVDINTRNHACARNVGRKKGFYVITYGWGVHVGTDGMNRRKSAKGKRRNPTTNFSHWPVSMADSK